MKWLFLGLLGSIFLVGCDGLVWDKPSCPTPERPEALPVAAFWVGGCDGGYWVKLLEIDSTREGIGIMLNGYLDYDGTWDWKSTYRCSEPKARAAYTDLKQDLPSFANFVDVSQLMLTFKDGRSCICNAL